MSTMVRYKPEDRILDLAKLSPSEYDLICSLHGTITRGQGILVCLQSSADDNAAEMHIRCKNGRYWAVHFAGGAHPESHEISRETDEHRRQKDYWHRAAADAGYEASTEFRTGGGTILDVAIHGPRKTGIEVQHSSLSTKLAKTRTTKTYRAGWLPVWFLDSDRTPDWFDRVPALGCNSMPWSSLPPRRSATVARGLSTFTAVKCRPGAFDRCPAGRKRPCGQWHPQREPWAGLTVDDVAERVPAERILPMRDTKGYVHLVSPDSLDLYRRLTGSGDYTTGHPGPRRKTPPHTTRCANPLHDRQKPTHCACGQEIYPLTQLIRVRDDICEKCRIKLGLPAPQLPS